MLFSEILWLFIQILAFNLQVTFSLRIVQELLWRKSPFQLTFGKENFSYKKCREKLISCWDQFFSWKITPKKYDILQKMKFSIKDFLSKCKQIPSFLQTCSHLLKKHLTKNFICVYSVSENRDSSMCSLTVLKNLKGNIYHVTIPTKPNLSSKA